MGDNDRRRADAATVDALGRGFAQKVRAMVQRSRRAGEVRTVEHAVRDAAGTGTQEAARVMGTNGTGKRDAKK